ncbi:thymidine phosphorylase family protein [Microbulbifer sp. SAOS-129_SWC]|uniref:thymidine phosphorylase family protein n=1 Tax=Microbulbifer sp. SAOS-129_SWC TaxID=3145235 RepID=UPI0032180CFE
MVATGQLRAVRMGIDTHEEPIVFMRSDCAICHAEGFTANTRLQIHTGERHLIATLNMVSAALLPEGTIGFSESSWQYLRLEPEQLVRVRHTPQVHSLSALRKKIYGHELQAIELQAIVRDINRRLYSDIEIASFLTACAGERLTTAEVIALTRAMVGAGNTIRWPNYTHVFDKHCIGGLPGNRTTPIVIAICSAAGLVIPKTSSRAITSPAGTADTMEVLTEVDLSLEQLQRVVNETGACLAAGGRVGLSPTDDQLIRIERALDLDSEGQLVASVLSKKVAAGSTDILIDMPVGPTAKLRDRVQAERLIELFHAAAAALQLRLRCVITDGSQAIGNGIGPTEEARDVIAVLQNHAEAPADLTERALYLAAQLLVMQSGSDESSALARAREILHSGRAWTQFQRICAAQGGLKEIVEAPHRTALRADRNGHLLDMDNRRLAQLAKLAGAPSSAAAGLRLHVKVGDPVIAGQPLATLYADTAGELIYARDYFRDNRDLFKIGGKP